MTEKDRRERIMHNTMKYVAGCDDLSATILTFDPDDRPDLMVVECMEWTAETKLRGTQLIHTGFALNNPRGDAKFSLVQEL